MNNSKILHVMILEKFLPPFIDFVDEHFGRDNHHYVFISGEKYDYGLTKEHNVEFLYTDDDIFITLLGYMKIAKKIILHGLWRDKVNILLYFNPQLLKKCYWVMWGGDFYFPELHNQIKHQIIKNMGNCIPVTYDDYIYIQSFYASKATYHTCINYPKSIKIPEYEVRDSVLSVKKIMIGNSATSTNRHLDVFDLLKQYSNLQIFVPLSYGDKMYASQVIEQGKKLFKEFFPLVDFMEYEQYLDILKTIDIVIFNHNRQQGVGNIILLLGLGKTLYLSRDNNAYNMLKDLGIVFYDILSLNDTLGEISLEDKKKNRALILQNYSEKKSAIEWERIFE